MDAPIRTTQRLLIFYTVGAMGVFVQMLVLLLLTQYAHIGYIPATALGVEAAVLHNFIWHERWTWADRATGRGSFLKRLLAFHAANGAVSLLGNLMLMRFFVGRLELAPAYASGLAITLCSILNYVAGDRIVFGKWVRPQ